MVLFFSDFEEGDGSEWDSENKTPSYNATYAKNGNYGMKCDSDSSGTGDFVTKTNSAWKSYTHITASFWFQFKQNFAAYDILSIFVVDQVGIGEAIQVNLKYEDPFGGQVLRCYTGASSVVFQGIAINTWYFLEIDSYVRGNTTFKLTGFADQTTASTTRLWEKLRFGCVWRGIDTGVNQDIWFDDFLLDAPLIRTTHIIEIRGDEKRFLRLHYIKSHPSPYPDTFDIRMLAEDADNINYWDIIDVRKDGVTEFVGFVEEKTPIIEEDGLEYLITGRCWKAVAWKKKTERFIETREVGPAGESGFFGKVYPRELLMFFLRTPFSIHPAGKVRHKIGWGIPSDAWIATANRTNSGFYPAWAICRHLGFAWQNGIPAAPEQQLGDYYQIDMGQEYARVTAILIESRDDITETQFARNFEIQLSSDGVAWTAVRSFDGYGARDILASWAPVNNVRYIRIYITLTRTDNPNWEISQVYVWQADDATYRLLDEEETDL